MSQQEDEDRKFEYDEEEVNDNDFILSGGYQGPTRNYPKKTFNDGLDSPTNVLREITEIPRYLDYTVFSKNQLRLAEKIFKTQAYTTNENYIRSKNFFIKLNKPGYWHKTNISVLFDNINTVFDIELEIIKQLKEDDPKLFNLETAKNIDLIINRFKTDFFNMANIVNEEGDYIKYLKKLTDYTYCVTKLFKLSSATKTIKFAHIGALGVVLALYNKIVSILSYVNPYVMVQKDSGVNTMTPPSFKGSNLDNLYKGMRDNLVVNLNNEILATSPTVTQKKKRKVNAFQSNTKKLADNYKKNPLIRLIQYPLYSLNILLPATIAPLFFMRLDVTSSQSFKEITKVMATTRVLGRYLKINNSSFYSKIIWLNSSSNDTEKLSVKIRITKEKIDLIIYSAGESNIKYYKDLIYYVENHVFCYGDIDPSGTFTHIKLLGSTSGIDAAAKAEAEKAIITLKDKSDPINSDLIAEKNSYRRIVTN